MSKSLSASKNRIIMMIFLAAVVLVRSMIVMFSKGKPSVEALVFGVLMCLLSVVFFVADFPTTREEFFEGKNIIRIVSVLVVFIGAFSALYVNAAFNFIMTVLPVVAFCSSDVRFMPISVVASLAVLVRYEPFAYAVIPCAIIVALILVAPGIKEAKTWEKIVFSATLICLTISFFYVVYQMRFIFSMSTLIHTIPKTALLMIIAALCVLCAIMSLKTTKPPKSKKKAKNNRAVQAEKPEYLAAFSYIATAVYAFASAMLEGKFAMCCIIGLLMSLFMICRNGTAVQLITDKVAKAAGGFIEKIADEPDAE